MAWFNRKKDNAPATAPQAAAGGKSAGAKQFYADKGGFTACEPEVLLAQKHIAPLYDTVSLAVGGSVEDFNRYVRPSIVEFARWAQLLPAAAQDGAQPHHAEPCGLLRHSLETMLYCLNCSREKFVNYNILSAKRASREQAFRLAFGLAGLTHDVGKLADLLVCTYLDEDNKVYWNGLEPLPDFLCRVHHCKIEEVYAPAGPRYIVEGWREERSGRHDLVTPFYLRSLISRPTLAYIASCDPDLLFMLQTASILDLTMLKDEELFLINQAVRAADHVSAKGSEGAGGDLNGADAFRAVVAALQQKFERGLLPLNQGSFDTMVSSCLLKPELDAAGTPKDEPVFFLRFDELFQYFCAPALVCAIDDKMQGAHLDDSYTKLPRLYRFLLDLDLIENKLYTVAPLNLRVKDDTQERDNFLDQHSDYTREPPVDPKLEQIISRLSAQSFSAVKLKRADILLGSSNPLRSNPNEYQRLLNNRVTVSAIPDNENPFFVPLEHGALHPNLVSIAGSQDTPAKKTEQAAKPQPAKAAAKTPGEPGKQTEKVRHAEGEEIDFNLDEPAQTKPAAATTATDPAPAQHQSERPAAAAPHSANAAPQQTVQADLLGQDENAPAKTKQSTNNSQPDKANAEVQPAKSKPLPAKPASNKPSGTAPVELPPTTPKATAAAKATAQSPATGKDSTKSKPGTPKATPNAPAKATAAPDKPVKTDAEPEAKVSATALRKAKEALVKDYGDPRAAELPDLLHEQLRYDAVNSNAWQYAMQTNLKGTLKKVLLAYRKHAQYYQNRKLADGFTMQGLQLVYYGLEELCQLELEPEFSTELKLGLIEAFLSGCPDDKIRATLRGLLRNRVFNKSGAVDLKYLNSPERCMAVIYPLEPALAAIKEPNPEQKDQISKQRSKLRRLLSSCHEFPFYAHPNDLKALSEEEYYFGFNVLSPDVAFLLLNLGVEPTKAELAERPATRPGRPPSARELLSFLRFKLYFANPGDKLFGCKVAAVEGDPDGRSVSSRAILNAAESFGMRLSDKNLQIALAAAASFSGPVLRRKGHNIITTTGPAKAGA